VFHNTLNAKSKDIKILSKHLGGNGREGKARRQEGIIAAASVTRHKKGEVSRKKYKKCSNKRDIILCIKFEDWQRRKE